MQVFYGPNQTINYPRFQQDIHIKDTWFICLHLKKNLYTVDIFINQ